MRRPSVVFLFTSFSLFCYCPSWSVVYLSVSVFVSVTTYVSMCLFLSLSHCFSVCFSAFLCLCLFCLSVCPSVRSLPVGPFLRPSIHPSEMVCLSLPPSHCRYVCFGCAQFLRLKFFYPVVWTPVSAIHSRSFRVRGGGHFTKLRTHETCEII